MKQLDKDLKRLYRIIFFERRFDTLRLAREILKTFTSTELHNYESINFQSKKIAQ